MFTLRCTQKLLRRGLAISPAQIQPTSTLLGDWYANLVYFGPHQLILCTSTKTLLPIVVTAKDARAAPIRIRAALGAVLACLDIPGAMVDRELAQMEEFRVDRTADRRLLSSLNEMAFLLRYEIQLHGNRSLIEHALRLAQTPMKYILYDSPDRATRTLFSR